MTQRASFAGAILFLAVLRCWLGAADGFEARHQPHDELRYAEMADSLIRGAEGAWLGPYDELTLIREPGFPLWVALVHAIGLPLKVAADFLHAGASIAFALSLRRVGVSRRLSLLVLAGILFQPPSFYWNAHLAAEALYAPVLLLAMGALMSAAATGLRPAMVALAFGAGLAAAVLWILRPERELLFLTLLVFLVLDAACAWRDRKSSSHSVARVVALALPMALPIAALDSLVQRANFRDYGVSVMSEITDSTFQKAYRTLIRVRPDRPRRYYSMPSESRRKVYSVSPAFRTLEPHLEGAVGARWREMRPSDRLEPDIPDGWFHWALREAAAAAGHHRSAPVAASFYRRMRREVEAALESGALPARSLTLGPLNPDFGLWITHVPWSVVRVGRMLLGLSPLVEDDRKDVPESTRALVDLVTRRGEAGRQASPIRRALQLKVRRLFPILCAASLLVAALHLLARLASRRRAAGLVGRVVVPVLLTVILGRLVLFGIIDASSFTAQGARYMYPVVGLSWAAFALGGSGFFSILFRFDARRDRSSRPEVRSEADHR